ncbi:MAG: hypothetical protein Q7S65_03675 [Nanoarchaeota archaeon]|nr:hypothetical protein [Nanoarchaeota archaeon]
MDENAYVSALVKEGLVSQRKVVLLERSRKPVLEARLSPQGLAVYGRWVAPYRECFDAQYDGGVVIRTYKKFEGDPQFQKNSFRDAYNRHHNEHQNRTAGGELQDRVLDMLQSESLTGPEIVRRIRVERTRVYEALAKLRKAGTLAYEGKGQPYTLTAKP